MQRLLTIALVLWSSYPAAADRVEVGIVDGPEFSLDIDGDGLPELKGFYSGAWDESIGFGILVDGTKEVVSLGGDVFVGIAAARTETAEQMLEAKGFSGSFTPPGSIERNPEYDPIGGAIIIIPEEPILATWSYGTKGTLLEPVHLIGMVIDARDFYDSEGTETVKVYYHDYGPIGSGEAARWITLADTGADLGEDAKLAANVEFPNPRTVCFEVDSVVGKEYRIIRKHSGDPEVVVSATGTGAALILEWDDSVRSDTGAFFSLEELDSKGFDLLK